MFSLQIESNTYFIELIRMNCFIKTVFLVIILFLIRSNFNNRQLLKQFSTVLTSLILYLVPITKFLCLESLSILCHISSSLFICFTNILPDIYIFAIQNYTYQQCLEPCSSTIFPTRTNFHLFIIYNYSIFIQCSF